LSCLHNGTMIPMISMMTGCTCIGLLLIFGPGPVTNRAQRDL
jgi:hypothetical protein